jgi:hypothetical protein
MKEMDLSHGGGKDPIILFTHVLADAIRHGFSEDKIEKLIDCASPSAPEYVKFYAKSWAADCYLTRGEYQKALEVMPIPSLGRKNAALADSIMSVRLLASDKVTGSDLSTLMGARGLGITEWGRANLREIIDRLDTLLESAQREDAHALLGKWAGSPHCYEYQVFSGLPFPACVVIIADLVISLSGRRYNPGITCYAFSKNLEVTATARRLARMAENVIRTAHGHPAVRSNRGSS